MRALVVYESMYGNTRLIAEAIARGLGPAEDVAVVPVDEAAEQPLDFWDLVVVGGPTHVHGMSRKATRQSAVDAAHKPDSDLHLEPATPGEGLREWLDALPDVTGKAAAFDTRIDGPALLTGSASKSISKKLQHHGFEVLSEPQSFLVSKESRLLPGEEQRAQEWGHALAART